MAWQRVDDRQLEWDLLQAGLLYFESRGRYYHYTEHYQVAWLPHKSAWLSIYNRLHNYIHVDEE